MLDDNNAYSCLLFPRFSFIATYYWLPETENRSLEDIERHFSDKTKKLTDIHIQTCNGQAKDDNRNGMV